MLTWAFPISAQDPVGTVSGDPFTFNRYMYANNNPLIYIDPYGESVWSDFRDWARDTWDHITHIFDHGSHEHASHPEYHSYTGSKIVDGVITGAVTGAEVGTAIEPGGGTVAGGVVGGIDGGIEGGLVAAEEAGIIEEVGVVERGRIEYDSKGNIVSRSPKSVQDKLTLQAAKQGHGRTIIRDLNDPRHKGMDKVEYRTKSAAGRNSVVHYVKDPATGEKMDFKFKKHSVE